MANLETVKNSPVQYFKILKLLLLFFFITTAGNTKCNAQTFVEQHGQLRVQGNRIVDKNGVAVQLTGMSLYWSQWVPKYYNYNTVKWLRDDWCINVIRVAMAVGSGGYETNPTAERNKVITVVDAAIALGIYVIIDFHEHEAHNKLALANTFFADMAQRYGNSPNVIYEPFNEPLNVSWSSVIKPYHESVITTIRKYDPDNIIICGTRNWSQGVGDAAADPINRPNIAYTLHYYAASHKQWLRDAASSSMNKGIALFVTEYGTTEASGKGFVDEAESKIWWAFLDQHKIGHCNWSVADIPESSAALMSNASTNGGWTTSQIKQSGNLVRNELRKKCGTQNPAPIVNITAPANNANFCVGSVITLSASATDPNGTITKLEFLNGTTVLSSLTSTPYTYQWTNAVAGTHIITARATDNGGAISLKTVTVIVNSRPLQPSVITPVNYCQNATATPLTAPGTGLKWYTTPTGGLGSIAAPIPNTTTAGAVTHYVSQTANNCEGPRASITVNVVAAPAIIPYVQINGGTWLQQNTAQVCAGGTIALGPQPVISTGWSWTGPNGFVSNTREITLTNLTGMQAGNYIARYTLGGCIATQTFTITVHTIPSAPAVTSPVAYCQNVQAAPLSAAGFGLRWYTSSTGGSGSVTALIPTTSSAGSTTYYVSQTTNGCEGTRAAIAVNVNATPAALAVTTPVNYCQNETAIPLTATGTGLKWYTGPSGGASSTTAPIPLTTTAGTANHYVSQTVNGCEGPRAMISVNVNPLPVAEISASGPTTIVEGNSVWLSANQGPGLTYEWFHGSSALGIASSFEVLESGIYLLEVTNNTGCKSISSPVNVTVNTNQPSVITILSPANNSTINGPINITADITDPDGEIILVEYLEGNSLIGNNNLFPYNFNWGTPNEGNNVIRVRVTDSNGGVTISSPVTVVSGNATGIHSSIHEILNGKVYPNPTREVIFVETDVDLTNAKLKIVNVLGVEIQLPTTINVKNAIIDSRTLTEGSYILIIEQDNKFMQRQIHIVK